MSDRTNHRRVLHFAVTGVLLGGAVGCTGNERPKDDAKTNSGPKVEPQTKQPEPEVKLATNPGPNELEGKQPEVAPTTAVPPPEPIEEPIEEEYVNERPVEEPPKLPETKVSPPGINVGSQREPEPKLEEKRVNTQRVREPLPEPKPPIKVNPGPEGRP